MPHKINKMNKSEISQNGRNSMKKVLRDDRMSSTTCDVTDHG